MQDKLSAILYYYIYVVRYMYMYMYIKLFLSPRHGPSTSDVLKYKYKY